MRRLICAFVVHICHKTHFLMARLKCKHWFSEILAQYLFSVGRNWEHTMQGDIYLACRLLQKADYEFDGHPKQLMFEQCGFTIEKCIQKIETKWQTVWWTLMTLLLQEQPDLGLHSLPRPVFQSVWFFKYCCLLSSVLFVCAPHKIILTLFS